MPSLETSLDAQAIRQQLDRILSSPIFWHTESLKRFLRYLLEESIAGREEAIKEYVLGAAVFDRGESFDPKEDTIVRVQARRLRAKLDAYYEQFGQADPIRIELPKGSYVPVFRTRAPNSVLVANKPAATGRRWVYAAAPVALAVVVTTLFFAIRSPRTHPRSSPMSLVVLPFTNLTGDTQKEYIGDGLTEDLIGTLSGSSGLRVVARTSAYQYKNKARDVRVIGRELGVGAVLEGSFRSVGPRLRISAQLVSTTDGFHLWSRDYDCEFDNLLGVRNDIAEAITATLKASSKASPSPRRFTSNRRAYESYMRGLWLLRQGTASRLEQSIDAFAEAATADPAFAPAFAQLAAAYAEEASSADKRPRDVMPKARFAALRALALDNALPEAHLALGIVKVTYDWDRDSGCREITRALQLDPGDAHFHGIYAGMCLIQKGLLQEARQELRIAQMLDPATQAISAFETSLDLAERRHDAVLERCKNIAQLSPEVYWVYPLMGQMYAYKGEFREAQKMLARASRFPDGNWKRLSVLAQLHAMVGQKDKARELAYQLEEQSRRVYVPPTYLALIYARLDDPDTAFDWLERAYEERCGSLSAMKFNEAYDPLRTDKRFGILLKKVGLE